MLQTIPLTNTVRSQETYISLALAQVPRYISQLDREASSATYGSFDRDHWAWKFRDFPLTMLQTGILPLALLWLHPFSLTPFYRSERLLDWIIGAVNSTLARQRSNGAFDSVGPFTQDHGVSLAMAYGLTETFKILEQALPEMLGEAIREAVDRACRFALRSEEDYAFITNHQALFALAFLNAGEILGEERYRIRAEWVLEQIIKRQSKDGWYQEYEGPDPGYESLGIFYLAKFWNRTGISDLLESLRRSVNFFAACVHPDGSVGGAYGSRHTSLYFPAGFEILAGEIPLANSIANFMASRLARRNVVTPDTSDVENLATLLYSYLEAGLASKKQVEEPPLLPCEALEGLRRFESGGICTAGSRHYYAIFNGSKGGIARIFDKKTQQLVYEDAGYLLRAGGRLWTSQMIGSGHDQDSENVDSYSWETTFAEVRQEPLTPGKFIVLRILNLTVFRNLTLGNWIRKQVLNRLILVKRSGPFRLQRTVCFEPDEIRFNDRIAASDESLKIEELRLERTLTAIHMGSAKYFHTSDLTQTLLPDFDQNLLDLTSNGKSQIRFSLRFFDESEPVLYHDLIPGTVEKSNGGTSA